MQVSREMTARRHYLLAQALLHEWKRNADPSIKEGTEDRQLMHSICAIATVHALLSIAGSLLDDDEDANSEIPRMYR